MGKRHQVAVLSLALSAVAACASQQVTVDYNPDAGFSSFRTFAMVSRPDSAFPQLIDDGARAAIEAQLEAKGLKAHYAGGGGPPRGLWGSGPHQ
jgi:hypothetical protein